MWESAFYKSKFIKLLRKILVIFLNFSPKERFSPAALPWCVSALRPRGAPSALAAPTRGGVGVALGLCPLLGGAFPVGCLTSGARRRPVGAAVGGGAVRRGALVALGSAAWRAADGSRRGRHRARRLSLRGGSGGRGGREARLLVAGRLVGRHVWRLSRRSVRLKHKNIKKLVKHKSLIQLKIQMFEQIN